MQVFTTKGLIERELLTVADTVIEEGDSRITITEWRLGDEVVRRDGHINLLRPQIVGVTDGL